MQNISCSDFNFRLLRNLYIRQRNFMVLLGAPRTFQWYPLHVISPNNSGDMINLGQVGELHDSSGTQASWTLEELIYQPTNFMVLSSAPRAFQRYPLHLVSHNNGIDMINLGLVGELHDSSGTRASWTLQELIYPPTRFYGLVRSIKSFPTVPFASNKS